MSLRHPMTRRSVMALIGAAALTSPSPRARARELPIVGVLSPFRSTTPYNAMMAGLRQGLLDFGYREGESIRMVYRWAEEHFERLPQLAGELVELPVDAIVAVVTQASLAAKSATSKIPIVMIGVADPVNAGLVASLAHSQNNVTGTSSNAAEIAGKPLQALKEVVPHLERVAVLWNPTNAIYQRQILDEADKAAHALGLEVRPIKVRDQAAIDAAFASMSAERAQAFSVLGDPVINSYQTHITDLAIRARLPSASGNEDYVKAGGLIAYGPSYYDLARRAAYYVDRLLKGAKPASLPIEQATKFDLTINLKTARALGL